MYMYMYIPFVYVIIFVYASVCLCAVPLRCHFWLKERGPFMAVLGFCCSRRREGVGESAVALEAWVRLTRGVRRVARLRRIFAFVGHWLQEIKARGRQAYLIDAPRSKTRR